MINLRFVLEQKTEHILVTIYDADKNEWLCGYRVDDELQARKVISDIRKDREYTIVAIEDPENIAI